MDGSNTYNNTDLQYVLPEIWSSRINDLFRANLIVGGLTWDVSDMISKEGRYAHIPSFTTAFTVQTQSTPGTEVTLESPAGGETKLEVDTWKYIAFIIAKHQQEMLLKSLPLQAKLMSQAAYLLAKAYDTAIMTLYAGLSNQIGDTANNLSDKRIREAVNTFDSADVPYNDRAFIMHPAVYWEDIMGISKYYDPNAFPPLKSPISTGTLGGNVITNQKAAAFKGGLYGIPLYVTTQVVSADGCYYNMLLQKDAFVHATPTNGIDMASEWKLENLGTLSVMDTIYGVKENRDACGVLIQAENKGSYVT